MSGITQPSVPIFRQHAYPQPRRSLLSVAVPYAGSTVRPTDGPSREVAYLLRGSDAVLCPAASGGNGRVAKWCEMHGDMTPNPRSSSAAGVAGRRRQGRNARVASVMPSCARRPRTSAPESRCACGHRRPPPRAVAPAGPRGHRARRHPLRSPRPGHTTGRTARSEQSRGLHAPCSRYHRPGA